MNDLLRQYPPPIRETVDRLRGIVHAIAPGAREKVNRGWRSINYLDPQVGYFCGIFPFEDKVDLIFEFGTLLPDPERMLEGEAKQTLYLRFRRPSDIRVQPTKAFIRAALALPPEHSTRRGLIQSKASPSRRALREWSPSDLPSKADRGCAGIFRREWKAGLLVEPSKSQPRPLQWHTNMMREVK